jgi:hypothetical protein
MNWQVLSNEKGVTSSAAGRACGVRTLTSVSYLGEVPLVGSACSNPGVVGIFARHLQDWQLVGPRLPSSLGQGWVEVLTLGSVGQQLSTLLDVSGKSGTDLVASWTTNGDQWTVSSALAIPRGAQLLSFGPDDQSGFFALLRSPSGADELVTVNPDTTWRRLPAPPSTTATVAFNPNGPVDALSVTDTELSVWTLETTSARWVQGQIMFVPIVYGSSS